MADTAFKDLKRHAFEHVVMDDRLFSVTARYIDAGVNRDVRVLPSQDNNISEAGGGSMDVERIAVTVSRTPAAVGAEIDLGYISNPRPGHSKLLLPSSRDARQEPYSFTGEIENERDDRWTLVFERKRTFSQGVPG